MYEYFVDLGIKGRSPSFVYCKVKIAGQDELEVKAISSHLSGVSVPTIATRLSTVLLRVDNHMTSSMYLVVDRRV